MDTPAPTPRASAEDRTAAHEPRPPSPATKPADVIRSFYAALAVGDVPAVLALLHDELAWTESPHFPYYSGTWHSPQEVLDKLLVPIARDWVGFSALAHEFISEGNRVVSLGTYTGTFRPTGRSMSAPFAHAWTVTERRIARFDMYVDSMAVLAAMR